jgi:hypothetical protein
MEARGQLGYGEGDGGPAGQVETQLLELVLGHFLADAKAVANAHGLCDRLLALTKDGELALEETAVLDPACVLDEPGGLVGGLAQRGTFGVAGLLVQIISEVARPPMGGGISFARPKSRIGGCHTNVVDLHDVRVAEGGGRACLPVEPAQEPGICVRV